MPKLKFTLNHTDQNSSARAGTISLERGEIKTPVFMPVGTHGAIKGVHPKDLLDTNAQIMLCNTYHMHIKPGEKLVKKFGGLHNFIGWKKPILTDSGGFQVFSLPDKKITDEGVFFKPFRDDKQLFLDAPKSMQIQEDLGADIIMCFDECPPFPSTPAYIDTSLKRTIKWAKICKDVHKKEDQNLFGIVQGGMDFSLRKYCTGELIKLNFDGYAIGGLAIGEGIDNMKTVIEKTEPFLPKDKPRYVMGIGTPIDLLEAVERGVDMCDCIIPTRHARGAMLYTYMGKIRINSGKFKTDKYPLDTMCGCYTCQNFSRAYLSHLYTSNEILGQVLGTLHNLYFYQDFMGKMREAILKNEFVTYKKEFLKNYKPDYLENTNVD